MIDLNDPPTWSPDTCRCKIAFNKIDSNLSEDFLKFVNRCAIHKNSNLNEVLLHNQSFNKKYGNIEISVKYSQYNLDDAIEVATQDNDTDNLIKLQQMQEIINNRLEERKRIEEL